MTVLFLKEVSDTLFSPSCRRRRLLVLFCGQEKQKGRQYKRLAGKAAEHQSGCCSNQARDGSFFGGGGEMRL